LENKLKENYILIVDTEAIDLNKPFIYDIGLIVAKQNENGTYESVVENSFIIKQVYQNKELFNTAYYGNKRPKYVKMLKGKTSVQKYYGHAMRYIKAIIKQYDIKNVYAYNCWFDKKAFEFTSAFYKQKNAFKGLWWNDIQAIANNFIHSELDYNDFCVKNNYITEKGNLKCNAEITYKFITNNNNFIEDHMGLSDSRIELKILNNAIKKGYDFKNYNKRYIQALT
jgi:hypothetical protein